jgi:hypothetical protein
MAEPSGWRLALRYATTGGVPRRSLKLAVVVGSLLNLINQHDALLGALPVDWVKLGLTYMMPYLVSTYGAVTTRLAMGR